MRAMNEGVDNCSQHFNQINSGPLYSFIKKHTQGGALFCTFHGFIFIYKASLWIEYSRCSSIRTPKGAEFGVNCSGGVRVLEFVFYRVLFAPGPRIGKL